MNDGTLYMWGNKNTYQNFDTVATLDGKLTDIDFTLNYVVAVTDGNLSTPASAACMIRMRDNMGSATVPLREFLNGRKITSIYATSKTVCALLDDGTVGFVGDFDTSSKAMPKLHEGEEIVKIVSGTYHYTALTSEGRVFSWGSNTLGQCKVPDDAQGASDIFGGAFQSYAVDSNHELMGKWGLKGYLFGTDNYGANVALRIIQGGKMTMTIGAIAVIISTIIGIIIGCISGYFGGKVDMFLMRFTEIFGAIPFLPFAMILSALMAQMDISENEKDLHPHGHPWPAELDRSGPSRPRSDPPRPRAGVCHGCQGHGSARVPHRIPSYPAEHCLGHLRHADARLCDLHADGVHAELPRLRRHLPASDMGQYAQRRKQLHRHQELLVALAVPGDLPCDHLYLHQHRRRYAPDVMDPKSDRDK